MSQPEDTRVRHATQKNPIMINGLASIDEALDLMRANNRDILVIEKRTSDDEYGVICLQTIARKVIAKNRPAPRVSAYEVMIKPMISLAANMQARYAIQLLTRLNLDIALVMDGNDFLGTVTLNDLTLVETAYPISPAPKVPV